MDKSATAIERQLFVQDLAALRGADRLISMSCPGWEAKQGTSTRGPLLQRYAAR